MFSTQLKENRVKQNNLLDSLMKIKISLVFGTLFLAATLLQGQVSYLPLQMEGEYRPIGQLIPKTVADIKAENLTVGCEVLDRDYTDYDEYKTYLPALGMKKIRLQAGWAKTEKVKGVYDFAWLDHIIEDALSRGMHIWLQTSYGNPIYRGGGTINLGGGMPTSDEAKQAWNKWVEAMATRYVGKVHEWEIWNEPDLSEEIPAEDIVDMNIRTAEIIKKVDPDARIAGFAFCTLNGKLLDECLSLTQKAGKLDLFHWISYHGYEYRPENSYKAVMNFRRILDKYAPEIKLRQGENGAPSRGYMGGALDKYDWTELSQAKWDLRRLLGDHGHDVETSIFSIIDMAYPTGNNKYVSKLNVKGLIESNMDKKVIRPKLAYKAVQHFATLFDNFSKRIASYEFGNENKENFSHYLYRNADNQSSFLLWNHVEAPLNENKLQYIDFTLTGCAFTEPVWIDLLTGWIYEIPESSYERQGNTYSFRHVPVYDSPIVITDRSVLGK